MNGDGRRLALIVASSRFGDKTLQQLITPGQDAASLATVLGNGGVGDFETRVLLDRPSHEIEREIELFFRNRSRDDFLLIYFSTHGIKDDEGRLYLAATDTDRNLLRTTTVPASFVNEVMSACRSRRQVLILDCCHSGAFARGMVAKGDDTLNIRDQFHGRGRIVLTASNATQYAFQGDEIVGAGNRSVFTRHLIQGLESGQADVNGDGWITLDELYDYVYARVTEETPQQTPGMYAFEVQGNLILARSPLGPRPTAIDEPELADRYTKGVESLAAGHWQQALEAFEQVEADHPGYRDVADRLVPLRELASSVKHLGATDHWWNRFVYRFPLIAILLAAALPNAAASIFNFSYNLRVIVEPMVAEGSTSARTVFIVVALLVNNVAFGVGLSMIGWRSWPVTQLIGRIRTKGPPTEGRTELVALRQRCLKLGHYSALVGMTLWALAGPVYPISLRMTDARQYVYFIFSLAVGGLIAAAYPFFVTTCASVRVLYPLMVVEGSASRADRAALDHLGGLLWRYLLLAVILPMLTMTVVLLTGLKTEMKLLGLLGFATLVGLALVVQLFRAVEGDLDVLRQLAARSRPARE